MSRPSYIYDLEVPTVPVLPKVPKDTVEVFTKYMLSLKKADALSAPVEDEEPAVLVAKESIEEPLETHNSIPVSLVSIA